MAIVPCGSTWVAMYLRPSISNRSSTTLQCTPATFRALASQSSNFLSQESVNRFAGSGLYSNPCRRSRVGLVVRAGKDPYYVLKISKGASKSEVKTAYRKLARNYFLSAVQREYGKEKKFKEISHAYEVLSDDEKRSIYDEYGEAGLKRAGIRPADFSDPFDLFESLFEGVGMGEIGMGGRDSRNRPREGEDQVYTLVLNFKEAICGIEKEIEISHLETCSTCDGCGEKPGTKASKCNTCGGQGQVVAPAKTPLGVFQQVMTCSTCGGSGEISTQCNTCSGDGRVGKSKRISLKVPAGVKSGSRLRVRSEGNDGRRGGPPGDLFVVIDVLADPVLKRDDTNILCPSKVSSTSPEFQNCS